MANGINLGKVGPEPIVISRVKWCPYKWPKINGLWKGAGLWFVSGQVIFSSSCVFRLKKGFWRAIFLLKSLRPRCQKRYGNICWVSEMTGDLRDVSCRESSECQGRNWMNKVCGESTWLLFVLLGGFFCRVDDFWFGTFFSKHQTCKSK